MDLSRSKLIVIAYFCGVLSDELSGDLPGVLTASLRRSREVKLSFVPAKRIFFKLNRLLPPSLTMLADCLDLYFVSFA